MIAQLQKTRLISRLLLDQLREGRFPSISEALETSTRIMRGRSFGAPLTRLSPALTGEPISGPDGTYITRMFQELRGDLELLYEAILRLASETLDLYNLFAVRRDRLGMKLSDYRAAIGTLLAQVSAGSRLSAGDSFNTLDRVDLTRTTTFIDLVEGIATLPIDNHSSVAYDARGLQVLEERIDGQPVVSGTNLPRFVQVFSPFRLDAWYLNLPLAGVFTAVVNVTGADYNLGAGEEIYLNALQVEPTAPLLLQVDWSPDGFNWHPLDPVISEVIRDKRTFHFQEILVGYLRFQIRQAPGVSGEAPAVGIKRIQLLKRGFGSSAQLYSQPWEFSDRVHSAVVETETSLPLGSRLQTYLSRNADGPWLPITQGPLTFGTVEWTDPPVPLTSFRVEPLPDGTLPAIPRFWESPLNFTAQPLPETGELTAGLNQLELGAFYYSWVRHQDREHIPVPEDWAPPRSEARLGLFDASAVIGTADVGSTYFTTNKTPLAFAVDSRGAQYLALCLLQPDGNFSLQPGYNYRLRVALYCPIPITLPGQRVGVVNLSGDTEAVVAPFSVYLNGRQLFASERTVTHVNALSGSTNQYSLPLQSGWNDLEFYLQLPSDLPTLKSEGKVGTEMFFYFQPNVLAPDLEKTSGIRTVRAYRDPWTRVQEFDLRQNIPLGRNTVWAWKLSREAATAGNLTAVLLNFDPMNNRPTDDTTTDTPGTTLDTVNAGQRANLALRYAVDYTAVSDLVEQEGKVLYFRADFTQEPGSGPPPVLYSYRILVN